MKKRFLSLMLLMLLALPQLGLAKNAYSITEVRQQAEKGWHKTYTAHGREIKVDVQPLVPAVDKVPVSRCQHQDFPITLPEGDPLWHKVRHDGPGSFLVQRSSPGEEPAGALLVGGEKLSAKPWRVWLEGFDLESAYINSNPITFGELTGWLSNTLKSLGLDPSMIDLMQPEEIMSHAYYAKDQVSFLAPGWSSFHWPQQLHGMPVMWKIFRAFTDQQNFDCGTRAELSLCYRQPDNFWLGIHLIQPVETLAEDIPLAGFDSVLKALEKEIEAGRLRQVLHMKLGYALFEAPGYTPKEVRNRERDFYAFPVWNIGCLYTRDPKKEVEPVFVAEEDPHFFHPQNSLSYREILVNAQTGRLLNPLGKMNKAVIYPGFEAWERRK